jgi:hypothetical protein
MGAKPGRAQYATALVWAASIRCGCGRATRARCAGCLHGVCTTCAQVVRGACGDEWFCPGCRIVEFSIAEAEAVSAVAAELERLGCRCGDMGWLLGKGGSRVYFVTVLGSRRCPIRPTTVTAATKAAAFRTALRRARAVALVAARRQGRAVNETYAHGTGSGSDRVDPKR